MGSLQDHIPELPIVSSLPTMQEVTYNPQQVFSSKDYAVVLLNREIHLSSEIFLKIWNGASIRQVIDGGANHFFTFLDKLPDHEKDKVRFPDLATGDFDSITKESMRRLEKSANHCKIIPTEDQDETDFTKGLRVLKSHIASNGNFLTLKRVVAICEFTGRLDQILANLNTLHKNPFVEDASDITQVYLISSESLTWLIPGKHLCKIIFEQYDPDLTCGLIPFLGPTRYVSTGLKWNLTHDMVCNFGGLVSTSNQVVEKVVKITADENASVFVVQLDAQKYIFDV